MQSVEFASLLSLSFLCLAEWRIVCHRVIRGGIVRARVLAPRVLASPDDPLSSRSSSMALEAVGYPLSTLLHVQKTSSLAQIWQERTTIKILIINGLRSFAGANDEFLILRKLPRFPP